MRRSPPLFSILLISAAALAYEILLLRLFSVIQWHHFAYMVISLALLGYGMSGTFLSIFRQRLVARFEAVFTANAALFGISAIGAFLLAQMIPFNTLEIIWDPMQWFYLFIAYLLLSIPFFFAANCVCLAFMAFGDQIPRIYGFDLVGAGLGALGVIVLLFLLPLQQALQFLALAGLAAAALMVMRQTPPLRRIQLPALLFAACAILWIPGSWLALNLSEYKGLPQSLLVPETRVLAERSSPFGLLTLIESPKIPLRQAPGMSLNSRARIPDQLGVFTDGDGLSAITRYSGEREELAYLDYLTSALPYHLAEPAQVLLLGMGGGSDLLQAEYHGVERMEVVELNPQWIELVTEDLAEYTGWNRLKDRVDLHLGEARGFLTGSPTHYDLMQLSLLDASSAASAGVYALSESYLYTVEGLREYLTHLEPDGLLSITRWVKLPPRDGLKLFATAVEALHLAGVEKPGERMVMIRGWKTSTLLLKNSPFTSAQIGQLKEFCKQRSFDLVHYPGMQGLEANRYNILSQPYFHQGAKALLGTEAELFTEQYKFGITPATDDRPYFFHFFKWKTLPEILSSYARGGFSLLELGYPVLVLTLLQAVIAGTVLVLFPLRFLQRESRDTEKGYFPRVVIYFLAIGLAFLFVEIAFIQKFILFLSHPLYAVAVVLCGFLVFSGLGSRYSAQLRKKSGERISFRVVLVLGVVAVAYLFILPGLFEYFAGLENSTKILISLTLIAPLAFCMGMPFPLGMALVDHNAPHLVPWAWGINGCASLVSAILATLLAIHFGFTVVILMAVVLYLIAGSTRL
jgi:hypothetical protein